jgi:hypothetical protein
MMEDTPRKVVRAGGFAVNSGLAAVVFGLLQMMLSSGAMAQSAALSRHCEAPNCGIHPVALTLSLTAQAEGGLFV